MTHTKSTPPPAPNCIFRAVLSSCSLAARICLTAHALACAPYPLPIPRLRRFQQTRQRTAGAGIVLTHKTLINRWPKSVVWLQWGTWSPGPSTKGALELAMSSSALWQHRRMGACSCLLFLAFVLKPASYLTIKLSGQKASKPFGQQAITRNS